MTTRRVVSESTIRQAVRDGQRTLDVQGALVTPSAREAAQRDGVTLSGERVVAVRPGSEARPARPARPERPARAAPAERSARMARGSSEARQERGARRPQGDGGARGAPPENQSAAAPAPVSNPTAAATGKSPPITIALGADHGGVALKEAIAVRLRELGHTVTDVGTTGTAAVDYPDFAVAVARAVASGRAALGIMVDGAGIGSCMAANKVRGVRAAMCYDVTTAQNAREHNGANVLTLGGGLVGPRLALAIVETFLATPFAGGRHQARVAKIDALDASR